MQETVYWAMFQVYIVFAWVCCNTHLSRPKSASHTPRGRADAVWARAEDWAVSTLEEDDSRGCSWEKDRMVTPGRQLICC